MVKKFLEKGKKILMSPQNSIFSAASVLMLMVLLSRVLGLVRQRTLAHFFSLDELSLFFAAFRLPDFIFEVVFFSAFSSAFLPVFTEVFKKSEKKAWETAAYVVNLGLLFSLIVSIFVFLGAGFFYKTFAPGFSQLEQEKIAFLTRILFFAQIFFILSYVLTNVLESQRRFLVPALAPIFYNLGIILGTYLFNTLGLLGPSLGVLMGAFLHFVIQLPLAMRLGFRFVFGVKISAEVKKVIKLAIPRFTEVFLYQFLRMAELFFASLISSAAYAYYTFGNTLQLVPIGLFGTTIAKASFPSLARERGNKKIFSRIFLSAFDEIVFLVFPIAASFIVLRIPVVRIFFGTDIFSWEDTVQTGMVVSYFALGVVFYSLINLVLRAFYALQDTKTPVLVSFFTVLLMIFLDFVFIKALGFKAWGLALAYSIGGFFQFIILILILVKRLGKTLIVEIFKSFLKSFLASLISAFFMFMILKILDRSVWVKRLSFFGRFDIPYGIPFESFVLDTRYTLNLLILTFVTLFFGLSSYFFISFILKNRALWVFIGVLQKLLTKRKVKIPEEEREVVSPLPPDTTS